MKTVWGAIEVWKRFCTELEIEEKQELFKKHMDAENYKQLCLELYFRKEVSTINFTEYPDLLQRHVKDLKDLYQGKTRGRIQKTKINKWIFSILYGNWRDQIDLNEILERKVSSKRKSDKSSFLRAIQFIPSVEVRMAVLDFFVTQIKLKKGNINFSIEDLEWALHDEHPWVIRTALPLFEEQKELVSQFICREIDMKLYPGVFDLDIELTKQGLDNTGYTISDMTELENRQLNWAKEKEKSI